MRTHNAGAAGAAIASYLAAHFGLDAARVLAMPLYGLEEPMRCEPIFTLSRLLGFDAHGIVALAACLGAAELAVMGVLVAYLVERLAGLVTLPASHETLRAGLVLAIGATLAGAMGAAFAGNLGAIAADALQLGLIGAAWLLLSAEIPARPAAPARAPHWRDPQAEGWFAA